MSISLISSTSSNVGMLEQGRFIQNDETAVSRAGLHALTANDI